ncbi:hypothetical protein [Aeromicrobium sp. Sec7.5]|uniref:hypothetical protein n=1 Tax=Aeromicrobium sp. Sec7.5 TaxID=3121276 RepID=UPI002FE4EB38
MTDRQGVPVSEEPQVKVRWGAMAIVAVVGFGVSASPFVLSAKFGDQFGTQQSLLATALLNVGTAVMLVAVAFLLERVLEKRVKSVARTSAQEVVETRTKDLERANSNLGVRLDALQAQLESQVAATDAHRFAESSRLASDVSFENVAKALEHANSLGALAGGVVVVPASEQIDGPRVGFSWGPQMADDEEAGILHGQPRMRLTYVVEEKRPEHTGTPVVEVDWHADTPAAEAVAALVVEMRRRGFGAEAGSIGAPMFQHLSIAIQEAMAGRAALPGFWVRGEMYEWVWDGWAVTDRGLVSRDHGLYESGEFPEPLHSAIMRGHRRGPKEFEAGAPEGVEPKVWETAVRRAKAYHPAGSYFIGGGIGSFYTSETTPR